MPKPDRINIFWFRRDLRTEDNLGLFEALRGDYPVVPLFIFDTLILEQLGDRCDKRVAFIHDTVSALSRKMQKYGSSLYVAHGKPVTVFEQLIQEFRIAQVMTNHDYEPYAIERDKEVAQLLAGRGIAFRTFKDQVIFDPGEILKPDGKPYVVFTPYANAWKRRLNGLAPKPWASDGMLSGLLLHSPFPVPSLEQLGFEDVELVEPTMQVQPAFLREYDKTRNLPFLAGTSYASVYLRFGTVSIRHLVGLAIRWNETWLNELIWREFFMMILYHFPRVVHHSFRQEYDRIKWRNNEDDFEAWCQGRTGYPLVDAGMRQLNSTGWMHNRVRMVVASFLTKHLLIDWRWGEAYFAEKLIDYELSSNNGNWQWAAGCGCDAAPYFRVFNPSEQAKKFDPEGLYVRTWIPDYPTNYPPPIVDHGEARKRALEVYSKALGS